MLPDIDQQTWDDYQKQQLQQDLDEKQKQFTLQQALNDKITQFQSLFAQPAPQPTPEPAPQPPPEPAPQTAPAQMPQPSQDVLDQGQNAAPMASPPQDVVDRGQNAAPMPQPSAAIAPVQAPSQPDEAAPYVAPPAAISPATAAPQPPSAPTTPQPTAAPSINQRLIDPSHYGYGDQTPRGGKPVRFIVNHVAAGEGSLYNLFQNQEANAHFWVGKNGQIEQYIPEDQAAYGAGIIGKRTDLPPEYPGNGQDYNRMAINIEREGQANEMPTPQQWQSLVALNSYLAQKYHVPVDADHIVGHYRTDEDSRSTDPYIRPKEYMDKLVGDVATQAGSPTAPVTAQLPNANQATQRSLPAPAQVADYIRYAAAQRGIDPETAVKVAGSEGLNTYTGDQGSSFGPFQLHVGGLAPAGSGNEGPGMGDTFMRNTGLDPRDPSTWKEQVDFALDGAAKAGWGPWHGAQRVGVGIKDGIGTFKGNAEQYADAAQQALAATGQAVGNAAGAVGTTVGNVAGAVGGAIGGAASAIGGAASNLGRGVNQTITDLGVSVPAAIDVTSPRNNLASQSLNAAIGDIPVIGGATQAALNVGSDLGASAASTYADQSRQLRQAAEQQAALRGPTPVATDVSRGLDELVNSLSDVPVVGGVARGTQAALDVIEAQRMDVINRPDIYGQQLSDNVDALRRQDYGGFVQGTLGLAAQIAGAADPLQGGGTADLSPAVSAGLTAAGVDPNVSRVLGQVANIVGPAALEKALPAAIGAAERGGAAAVRGLMSEDVQAALRTRQAGEMDVNAALGGIPEAVSRLRGEGPPLADAVTLRTAPTAAGDMPLSAEQVAQHADALAEQAGRLADQAAAETNPQRAADLQQQAQVLRGAQQQIATAPPETQFYAPRVSAAVEAPTAARTAFQAAREAPAGASVTAETPNARVTVTRGAAPQTEPVAGRHFRDLPGPVGRAQPLPAATARAAEAQAQANPYQPVMEDALGIVPPKAGTDANLATRFARAFTDRNVMLNQLQDQAETSLAKAGKQLGERLRAGDLARAQSEPAAQVKVQALQQVVRDMGSDAQALDEALKLTHNIQRSVATGERVTAEQLDASVPSHLADELRAANSSQRMVQRNHELLTSDTLAEADRVKASQRNVNAAQRRVDRAQAKIDEWKSANEGAAQEKGKQAAANVKFAGEEDAASSAIKLRQMEEEMGPQRWARIQNGIDRVQDYERSLRARLVDSQVMSPELAAELDRLYPNWIKTNVLQYMSDDTGAGMKSGTKLGLNDSGLRSYTLEGSEKPVESPLVGLARYTYEVERTAMKNEAALGFHQMTGGRDLRLVSSNYKIDPKLETVVNMFRDGEKQRYVTSNKWLGEAINGAGVADTPEWANAWTNTFRMLATGRNPLFLSANALNDAAEYLIRTSAIEGAAPNPVRIGGIMGTLLKTYMDTFQGILTGEFKGEMTQQYLLKGGGMATGFFRTEGPLGAGTYPEALSRLAGGPLVDVSSKGGLMKAVESFAKFRWVERIGERIELAPHVAAYRRALMRGENPTQAMIRGRDVTLDFARGGTVVKYINNFIPFFNASVQGSAQLVRMARDNPAGAALTVTTLIGVPTALAELWNRGYNPDGSFDDQRAQDYADVPQYEKDRGVVIMLPGDAEIDPKGNRRPNYLTINLRNFAAFSTIARDITARALGDETRGLGDTAGSVQYAALPQTNPQQILGSAARSVPGLSTAAQLAMNHDLYRDRYIMSNRADENASTLAKTAAGLGQPVADALTGGTLQVRPSAIDFAITNEGAGLGSSLLGGGTLAARGIRGATNALTGAEEPLPEDASAMGVGGLPGIGGLGGRFIRNQTGQLLQNESAQGLTPSARQALRDAGVTYTPGPVASSIQNVPLLQSEQVQYQQVANRYVDDELQRLIRSPQWLRLPVEERDRQAQAAVQRGRARAATQILQTIPAGRRAAVARSRLPTGVA